jgi:hypothetical protein
MLPGSINYPPISSTVDFWDSLLRCLTKQKYHNPIYIRIVAFFLWDRMSVVSRKYFLNQ